MLLTCNISRCTYTIHNICTRSTHVEYLTFQAHYNYTTFNQQIYVYPNWYPELEKTGYFSKSYQAIKYPWILTRIHAKSFRRQTIFRQACIFFTSLHAFINTIWICPYQRPHRVICPCPSCITYIYNVFSKWSGV